MDAWTRIRAIAAKAAWEGVGEGASYGTNSLKYRSKMMARLKDEATLVVRCPLDEKEMLIAAEPGVYYQTEHYHGYPALLVRLDVADDAQIAARLDCAWRMQAPKRVVDARDAEGAPKTRAR